CRRGGLQRIRESRTSSSRSYGLEWSMRTGKVEQRLEHGLARSRLAVGRGVGLRERARVVPTICSSSCTNKPRQWSRTRRHLMASGTFTGFFSLVTGITLPPSPNRFHEGSLTFLGQTVCFVHVCAQFFTSAGSRISCPPSELSRYAC